ncbi:Uncharacterized protein FWK35_00020372 [Aphis craccivora]|uniref:Uncharacterized protein n=1 Tax=Aphis craccivora TaxID=307492 RepID=A0A6G0YEB3_APHCR|nr:Uncharacterized protein FWK35_00020372 [Aphis craccivora]
MLFITSRNNAPISNFGGGFRCESEYPWCIIEVKSNYFPTVLKKIEKNKKKSWSIKFETNDTYNCIRKTILNGDDLSA